MVTQCGARTLAIAIFMFSPVVSNQLPINKVHTRSVGGERLEIPKDSLDLYVLGFPCAPWSLRGQGCGFQDANAKPFWVGLATIKVCSPKTFVLENAVASVICPRPAAFCPLLRKSVLPAAFVSRVGWPGR